MYKILIADDESSIREGLRFILPWEELGYAVTFEASNGTEALNIMLDEQPDLVLLDIRMPKMHGTEVIQKARENGFKGRCLILSGYSDFKYAQAAIKYGVDFYLLKPIDDDELLDAVKEVRRLLDEEKNRAESLTDYKKRAKSSILEELVTGNAENTGIFSSGELNEMGINAEVYQVVIYENYRKKLTAISYDFAELMNINNARNQTFEHLVIDENDVILLKGNIALKLFADFLKHYENKPPQKGSPLDTLFLAYGSPVNSPGEISRSYKEACSLINRRFFCVQGQHTLGYDELPDTTKYRECAINDELLEQFTKDLTNNLQTYNRKRVAEVLFRLEEVLYNAGDSITDIKLFLTDLYLRVKENISHLYTNVAIPFPTNSSVINLIENKFYLYEIILFFSEQFEMIMNATGSSTRASILDDIIYYIDHNYQSNIKLETIAPLFGYNSAYLGKIFNKAVNESFNSYVDHIRIEHSKELLATDTLKVYEIAERIGYRNVDYFHKKFKKYVGMSPAEYRKSILGRDTEE